MATHVAKKLKTSIQDLHTSVTELYTGIGKVANTLGDIKTSQQTESQKVAQYIKAESDKNAQRLQAMEVRLAKLESRAILTHKQAKQGNTREELLEQIVSKDLPKFNGIGNPITHIQAFREQMLIKGVKEEQWPILFPLSLETIPHTWFYSIDPEKLSNFPRIVLEFTLQYRDNMDPQTPKGRDALSKSTKDIPTPTARNEEHNVINILSTPTKNPHNNKREKRKFTPIRMTYAEAFKKLSAQGLIQSTGPTEDPATKPAYWDDNAYCLYHRGNGHDIENCFKLKHKIQDMIDSGELTQPKSTD